MTSVAIATSDHAAFWGKEKHTYRKILAIKRVVFRRVVQRFVFVHHRVRSGHSLLYGFFRRIVQGIANRNVGQPAVLGTKVFYGVQIRRDKALQISGIARQNNTELIPAIAVAVAVFSKDALHLNSQAEQAIIGKTMSIYVVHVFKIVHIQKQKARRIFKPFYLALIAAPV